MPRWIYGDTAPVLAPVDASQVVTTLDLVATDSSDGEVYRAEDQTFDTSESQTRSNFVARFLGVSAQDKLAGERVKGNSADEIRVDTAGEYEYPLNAATTLQVGDFVGPDYDSVASKLKSQVVKKVSSSTEAIGRVTKAGTNLTTATFRLLSTLAPLAK